MDLLVSDPKVGIEVLERLANNTIPASQISLEAILAIAYSGPDTIILWPQ